MSAAIAPFIWWVKTLKSKRNRYPGAAISAQKP